MPRPQKEVPTGAVDGVNTVFTTSQAYTAGSLVVFVRGLVRVAANDDGYTETDPNAGTFTMKEAPFQDDVVFVFYKDQVIEAGESVLELAGSIADNSLAGTISGTALSGTLLTTVDLSGAIADNSLSGTIADNALSGVISCP
jgi:hypothetical protein